MVKSKMTQVRQKIEIKPIANEEARRVSFSKRRPSIFKKASELSTLCGAKVAVVVLSPGGKSFSFGHPSVYSVIDHFRAMCTLGGHAMDDNSHGTDGMIVTNNHEKHQELAELQQSLEAEKQRKKNVQHALKMESGGHVMQCLLAKDVMLGLDELKELQKVLTTVESMVKENVRRIIQDAKQTRRPPPQPHMHEALNSQNKIGEGPTDAHYASN